MDTTTQLASFLLRTINEFQEEIHSSDENSDEPIFSPFYREFRKSTWFVHLPSRMRENVEGEKTTYYLNNTFHYLMFTDLRREWPALTVKPEYRDKIQICWTHNLGTNFVKKAQVIIDQEIFPCTLDPVVYDIYFEWYLRPGFKESHDLDVGNVPEMTQWSSHLPSYVTNVEQPFFYHWDLSHSIPLFFTRKKKSKEIIHCYYFKNKITDLLRMRIKIDDSWVEMEEPRLEFLVNSYNNTLPSPELWARYSFNTREEILFYTKEDENMDLETSRVISTYYVKDFINFEGNNPVHFSQRTNIPISSPFPCQAIFWQLENVKSRSLKCFSNYSADNNNPKGLNPVKSVSLKYGSTYHLVDMPADHFGRVEARKFFPRPPSLPGMHAYSYSIESSNPDADVGIVLEHLKAELNLTLIDPPYESEEEDDSAVGENGEIKVDKIFRRRKSNESMGFIPQIRLLVMRKIQIVETKEDYQFLLRDVAAN